MGFLEKYYQNQDFEKKNEEYFIFKSFFLIFISLFGYILNE